jgi:hypothetical protein
MQNRPLGLALRPVVLLLNRKTWRPLFARSRRAAVDRDPGTRQSNRDEDRAE